MGYWAALGEEGRNAAIPMGERLQILDFRATHRPLPTVGVRVGMEHLLMASFITHANSPWALTIIEVDTALKDTKKRCGATCLLNLVGYTRLRNLHEGKKRVSPVSERALNGIDYGDSWRKCLRHFGGNSHSHPGIVKVSPALAKDVCVRVLKSLESQRLASSRDAPGELND